MAQTNPPESIIATSYPSLQDAVNAARKANNSEVFLPAGDYYLDKTLDLSSSSTLNQPLEIRGANSIRTRIIPRTHGQPAVDLTGSSRVVMEDLCICANFLAPQELPNVGILLARGAGAADSEENKFERIAIDGQFTLANVYNCGSGLDQFTGCVFHNSQPGAHNLMWVVNNTGNIVSPYQGAIISGASTSSLRVNESHFYNDGVGDGGCNIYVSGATDLTVRDSYMSPPAGGYGAFLTSVAGGPVVSNCLFEGLRVEAAYNSQAVFKTQGAVERLSIRNSTIVFGGELLDTSGSSLSFLNLEENELWRVPGATLNTAPAINAPLLTDSIIDTSFSRWYSNLPPSVSPVTIACPGCQRNRFRLPISTDLSAVNSGQNTIEVLSGTGRTSRKNLTDPASSVRIALAPVNTASLVSRKKGDIALDDGTNTASKRPGLAIFDGQKWIYMN